EIAPATQIQWNERIIGKLIIRFMAFLLQSNGRVDGFTMCTLSDAYVSTLEFGCPKLRLQYGNAK
ncbi:hypothetical protein, partial [Phocaeicola plebeius]|uniref:hypothetical protein n=1 Tax=Phocaeicola plebeius TaxID=310297 RepID=UPI0026DB03C5